METPADCVQSYFRYLPVSAQSRRWGLWVADAGYTVIPPHTPYPPLLHPKDHMFTWEQGRVLSAWQLIYITRGRGEFESRPSGVCPVGAGDLLVLFPGIWHRYRPLPETGWNEYWIEFDGSYARKLMANDAFQEESPVLKLGPEAAVLELFTGMVDAIRNESFGFQRIIAARTMELIARILNTVEHGSLVDQRTETIVKLAQQRMQEASDQSLEMPVLARDLGVGYSWFRKVFRSLTGMAPAHYHLQLRLRRASILLAQTRQPINAIATGLGFESPYHFSRLFRKKTGESPSDYRDRHRQK